jgi:hypothetical protein
MATGATMRCCYNMLSRRLKERAGPGGPPYSEPVDEVSGPSMLSQVLRQPR